LVLEQMEYGRQKFVSNIENFCSYQEYGMSPPKLIFFNLIKMLCITLLFVCNMPRNAFIFSENL